MTLANRPANEIAPGTLIGELHVDGEPIDLFAERYQDRDGLAIVCKDKAGAPYAVLSVNLVEAPELPTDAFWMKHWSENCDIAAVAMASDLFEVAHEVAPAYAGFAQATAYRLRR